MRAFKRIYLGAIDQIVDYLEDSESRGPLIRAW
jgi:hypothetical protein